RNFDVDNIIPRPVMDTLIFVRAVDVFCQSIVIGITHRPGRSSGFMLSKTLVIDNADVLRSVVCGVMILVDRETHNRQGLRICQRLIHHSSSGNALMRYWCWERPGKK